MEYPEKNILSAILSGDDRTTSVRKTKKQENQSQQKNKQNLNWDAETVEYEEIKDETRK
jgi:hypothetical protein